MAKYLCLTNEMYDAMMETIKKQVGKAIPTSGLVLVPPDIPDKYARIILSPQAYIKIMALVHGYQSEVQWEGFTERLNADTFYIKDIVVFPHEVGPSTVIADQELYEAALDELTDEQVNSKKFHGHSHVNYQVVPSAVDMKYRTDRVAGMPRAGLKGYDSYAIFMIFNKRHEMEAMIYDVENNIQYDNKDIVIDIETEPGQYAYDFVEAAKKKTWEQKTATGCYGYKDENGVWHSYTENSKALTATKPAAPKKEKKENKDKGVSTLDAALAKSKAALVASQAADKKNCHFENMGEDTAVVPAGANDAFWDAYYGKDVWDD